MTSPVPESPTPKPRRLRCPMVIVGDTPIIPANGQRCSKTLYVIGQKATKQLLGYKDYSKSLPFQQNLLIGKKNEIAVRHIIAQWFKTNITLDENNTAKHDMWNDDKTLSVEVKTRVDYRHDYYETAFIDRHKIDAQKPGVEYYYVWVYSNGIFYRKYSDDWDKYDENRTPTAYRPEKGYTEKSLKIDIPREDLLPLCLFNDERF